MNTPQEGNAMFVSNSEDDIQLDGGNLELNVGVNEQNAEARAQTVVPKPTTHQRNAAGVVLLENGESRLQLANQDHLRS